MTEKQERIIMLVAGPPGCGKSFWVSCLPNALIIDTDIGGGLRYADKQIAKNGSVRVGPGSPFTLSNGLSLDLSISEYTEAGDFLRQNKAHLDNFSSVVVDNITVWHDNAVARHNPKFERDYGRGSDIATREWKRLRELMRSKDFNLICTAHLKGKWEQDVQVGMQASGPKEVAGDMDVVLFVSGQGEYPRTAQVIKWRRLPDDDRGRVPPAFPLTLQQFVKIDGTDALTRGRVEEPDASPEEIAKLKALLEVVKLDEKTLDRWLKAAHADTVEEMPGMAVRGATKKLQEMLKTATNGNGTHEPVTVKKGK